MQQTIEVPEYTLQRGIVTTWEDDFVISVRKDDGQIVIQANRDGLISLARLLLTLAQDRVPAGHHVHLDEYNSLEDGSCEIIFERM